MKKLSLLIIILFTLSLTGCIKKYELSEQQSDATAEYMAGLLLKYDKNYEPHLTPLDELTKVSEAPKVTEAITATPTPAQEATTENSDSGVEAVAKEYTLSEVIGVSDIEILYSGYKICESYPEDATSAYFSLTPAEGNQLLVASFSIKNQSNKEKVLDLSNSGELYQLDINVGTVYKPSLTLLKNNLQYIDITIGAGKTETALLIFEVSKDTDISDINLITSKEDRTEIIEIK